MKSIRFKSCFLGLATLMVSCSEINESFSPAQEQISINGTLDGFSAMPLTRTQVGSMAEDGALLMEWSVGDQVGMFGGNTVNAPFTGNHTAPAAQTTFFGSIASGDVPQYAYYPYNEQAVNLQSIPVAIPTEQAYADVNSIAAYDVKATDVITDMGNGTYQLNMRQMVSLVRFEISLTGVDGLSTDEKLQRVELKTGAPVTGSYTYDLTNLDNGFTGSSDAQSTSLNLTFVNQPSLSEKVIAYAVAAPGTQGGKTWECTFLTDKHQVSFTTTALCDFEAGKYYIMPLSATVLENNQAVIEDVPAQVEEETANCYMINTTGEHSFLATVIGNGQKGIIPGAGFHTESAYISPKSAKLLWQDVDGFIDASSVRLGADGRCYYTANMNVGNAVIAVYSGEDQTGDILWSWHIWGMGDESVTDDTYISSAGYEYTMMDRPLGAHSKYSNICTLYQWGRKDPFSNQNTVYFENGTATDVTFWPTISGTDYGTIAGAVASPDKYITFSATNSNGDWMQQPNNNLWGDDKEIPYKWPDVYGDVACMPGWVSQKTIYDPSPVGYRVSSPYAWTGILKNKGDASTPGSSSTRLDQVNFIKYENDGWYFLLNPANPEGVYYGTTGQRMGADGEQRYNGLYVYYFSSSPHRTRTMSTGLWCGKYVGPQNSSSAAHENAIRAMEIVSRGVGCAIRCERE